MREQERDVEGGREDNPSNTGSQREFEDEARERMRHAHAQRQNDQSVLAIVPSLDRVVPVVEHLN